PIDVYSAFFVKNELFVYTCEWLATTDTERLTELSEPCHGVSGGFPAYYCYDVMFSWLSGTVFFHLLQLAAHQCQYWRGLQAVLPPPT
ncbi:hypothetical protein, partial [Escherichia coli]|uniref:hypothetical protein n=1 Tax=Escherichia coli TaxID=562 RepID=UPI001FA80BC6